MYTDNVYTVLYIYMACKYNIYIIYNNILYQYIIHIFPNKNVANNLEVKLSSFIRDSFTSIYNMP